MSDDDPLGTLVRERWRPLVGYGYVLCGDIGEAEELVAEAVVRTVTRRRDELEVRSAEPYVRRAMLRLYVDGYRRRRRWAAIVPAVARPERVEADADVLTTTQLDVRHALAGLPRRERACVVLRYFDDLTVPQIAEQLAIAEGSVKRYLSQALGRLEGVLGPPDESEAAVTPSSKGEAR